MNFQISALGHEQFAPLFRLSNDELAGRFAVRRTATTKPGFSCRVSLADAEVGDQLILVKYTHKIPLIQYNSTDFIAVCLWIPTKLKA